MAIKIVFHGTEIFSLTDRMKACKNKNFQIEKKGYEYII